MHEVLRLQMRGQRRVFGGVEHVDAVHLATRVLRQKVQGYRERFAANT